MAEKIEVALCITELDRGGAEKIFSLLASRLDMDRYAPTVYCLRGRDYHQPVNFIPFLEEAQIPIHFLNMKGPLSVWRGIRTLSRLLRRNRTSVFQSFMFHANVFGRIAAARAKVPVICSGLRVSEKARKYHLWLDRLTAGNVDRWVCVSRSVAEFSEKTGKLPESRLVVIPNAVTENFIGRDNPKTTLFDSVSGLNAAAVGRLTYQKGIDWLLKTAPDWLNDEKAPNWHLWLIGEGDQGAELRRTAASLPPETASKIHFAGWRPDVPAILAAADLLLLPSRWEGMPNALLEGAAAGLPVLATPCDGVAEILGETLISPQTVPFGESGLWTEKILPLLTDAGRRSELGKANQDRVRGEFSLDKMISRYTDLWETLLREKTSKQA